MTHEQFKQKYIGQLFDYDGVAGAQCTDIAKAYVEEVHGKRARAFGSYPTKEGGVINAFYNYPNCFIYREDYELIENNPNDYDQLPQQGDIIIWGDYELTNQWGHIAVVDTANRNGFSSIDQNWNAGNGNHTQIVNHNYRGILGWLRLRGARPANNEVEIVAQVEAVKAEPAVYFATTSTTPGISYVLKALGSPVFDQRWAWETVGAANGYRPSDFDEYNRTLKVGQPVRIPTRLLPAPEPLPQSTVINIPESTQVESPVVPHPTMPETTPIVDDNPRMVHLPPAPVETTSNGRILGVSKKLTSAITAGIYYLGILNSLPQEVLTKEVGELPLSIWIGAVITVFNGLYIAVQGIIDYKSNT